MRDRLEPIWPSNKKLSRLKLKKRNGSTNAGRPAHSLPRTTRALKAKPPARRTRAYTIETKDKERPAEGSDSPRVRGRNLIFFCKKGREHGECRV